MDEDIYDWSDERCIAIAAKNYFPKSVMDVDKQKHIINKFLNFYLGGRIQNGMTVSDLVFAVISIMPSSFDTETFIWNESEYRSNGTLFFLSPEDRLNSEYNLIKNKCSTEANIHDAETINIQFEDILTSLVEIDINGFDQFMHVHDAESLNLQFEDNLTSLLEIDDNDEFNKFSFDIKPEQIKKSTEANVRDGKSIDVLIKVYEDLSKTKYEELNKQNQNKLSVEMENEIIRQEHEQIKNEGFAEANLHDAESIDTININLNIEDTFNTWINDQKIRKKVNEKTNKKTLETLLPQLSSVPPYRRATNTGNMKQDVNLIEYGPVENSAFITMCNKLLDDWDSDPNARIVLKYMFGVIALTLMRATTKSRKHLMNVFSSAKFMRILHSYNISTEFAPPHVRCIKSCCKYFIKKDRNVRIMFAKIANRGEYLFRATVLAHTANYGMGIFKMLQNIIDVYDFKIFLNVTSCTETEKSWRKILSLMEFKKKKLGSNIPRTYHWARIIHNDSFQHLNCADNYALAVIMAVFQHRINGDAGVWQSSWITGTNEDLEVYITLGMKMYHEYIEEEKKNKRLMEVHELLTVVSLLE